MLKGHKRQNHHHCTTPLFNLQTRQARADCLYAYDQGLVCPLTQPVAIVVYVNKQRMSRSDCMNMQSSANLFLNKLYTANHCYNDSMTLYSRTCMQKGYIVFIGSVSLIVCPFFHTQRNSLVAKNYGQF